MLRPLLWIVVFPNLLLGQAPAANTSVITTAGSGPSAVQWHRLSLEQKLRYDARHFFELQNFLFAGMGAGIDQWRRRPGEWGEGWGPLGQRYLSHVGYYLVQRSVMFPVQAVDHEEVRFVRSSHRSYQGRLGDALLETVWRRRDTGGRMPAYSEFLGDYAAAGVSRAWWPKRYHNGLAIFVAGSNTLLIDAGINALREFTPDLRRWLHLPHPTRID